MEEVEDPNGQTLIPFLVVDEEFFDLTEKGTTSFRVKASSEVSDLDDYLVVDIYDSENEVHPQGHVGWWSFGFEGASEFDLVITRGSDGIRISSPELAEKEFWINPDFGGLDADRLVVHIVTRKYFNDEIEYKESLCLYQDSDSLQRDLDQQTARQALSLFDQGQVDRWFLWPKRSRVFVAATEIRERDAVGNFAYAISALLRLNGVENCLYADRFDIGWRGTILPIPLLLEEITEQDVLILIYSISDPWAEVLNELPCKKIMLYSNVTPPTFFQVYDAELATHCKKSYGQVTQLDNFDHYISNSNRTRRDLLDLQSRKIDPEEKRRRKLLKDSSEMLSALFPETPIGMIDKTVKGLLEGSEAEAETPSRVTEHSICPPFITLNHWARLEAAPIELPKGSEKILYVGRISPNKKIEDLFLFLEEYKEKSPDACLILVGATSLEGYRHYLDHLCKNRHAAISKDIHFLDSVTDQELRTVYESADAFITMTEHEGYCIPLVEAMSFDLPVFAYAEEAVAETLGGAGLIFYDKVFSDIADEVYEVLNNPDKKNRFLETQRSRLTEIAVESNGAVLWKALEKLI